MKRYATLWIGLGLASLACWILLFILQTAPGSPAGSGPTSPQGGQPETPDGIRPQDPGARESTGATASDPSRAPADSATALLSVRVTERGSGRPIPGAGVALDPASGIAASAPSSSILVNSSGVSDARTDAQGECLLPVPDAIAFRLSVTGPTTSIGSRSLLVPPLARGEERSILVDLPVGLDLEFWTRVVDADSGAPIPGAEVRLYAGGPTISAVESIPRKRFFGLVTTDSDGRALLRVPSWRSVLAYVDAEGFGPVLTPVVEGHADPARPQVLLLSRAARLAVLVLSAREQPLSGVEVRLSAPSGGIVRPEGTALLGNDPEWSAPTDGEGRCSFERLPPEAPIHLEIRRGNEVLQVLADPLVLARGEQVERTITVGGGTRISGVLLSEGSQPLPGVEIWLSRAQSAPGSPPADRYFVRGTLEKPFATSLTGADGRFAFEDVQSGSWWIGPGAVPLEDAPAADAIAMRATGIHVPPDEHELEVVLRAELGLYVRGRVLDPGGQGTSGAFVYGSPEGAGGVLCTRSAGDGQFTLGPLARGSFRLQAGGQDGSTDSEPVFVHAGDRDVALRLKPGGILSGHVFDQVTGAPCAATVLLCAEPDKRRLDTAAAGRDAEFEFTGLRPGTYDLVARSDDGRIGILRGATVPEGGENSGLRIPVERGASLRIRYLGRIPTGHLTVLLDGTVVALEVLQAGTSSLLTVPKGVLEIRFRAGDGLDETRQVDTRAGDEEVVFRSE